MRHVVNFGLLFAFVVLAVTGVLAFARPFSLSTTQVHIVAGLATLVLVGMHLASRLPYFRKQVAGKSPGNVSKATLAGLAMAMAVLVILAVLALPPVSWLVDQSYESRNRQVIVRTSSLAGFDEPSPQKKLVNRVPEDASSLGLSLHLQFQDDLEVLPSVAVWAETTTGTMIETLYLQQSVAYSDRPVWHGAKTPRNHILPLWRHRYTAISGIGPDGKVDGVTGATETHRFALDPYLVSGEENKIILCVEVNAPHDPNDAWPEERIGQPSLLYTAYLKIDEEARYYLLELTGHGGGAEASGDIHYDLDEITSAKGLLDLGLVKLEDPPGATEE